MPPSITNKLTDVKIKNLKPSGKVERYADGGGLYLEISPAGSKLWRMKYRVDGKEKRLAFGIWPMPILPKPAKNHLRADSRA